MDGALTGKWPSHSHPFMATWLQEVLWKPEVHRVQRLVPRGSCFGSNAAQYNFMQEPHFVVHVARTIFPITRTTCGQSNLTGHRGNVSATSLTCSGAIRQLLVALVLDLAKAFERVCLIVVWAWATHFNFTRRMLRVPLGYFEHQCCVQFEGCVAEPLQTTRSKWSCLLLRICVAGRNE